MAKRTLSSATQKRRPVAARGSRRIGGMSSMILPSRFMGQLKTAKAAPKPKLRVVATRKRKAAPSKSRVRKAA